jgi:hypothetical protein
MSLMIVFLFSCIGIGILADRIRSRQRAMVTGLAVVMTLAYLVSDKLM